MTTLQSIDRLIAAATALLEARANQMVTSAEWQALRDALQAPGVTPPSDD